MRYVFDIETNGFLDDCDTAHCIVLKDIDTNEIHKLDNKEAVKKLEEAELIIGHNIVKFDIPCLEKLFSATFKGKIFDFLIRHQSLLNLRLLHLQLFHPQAMSFGYPPMDS